MVEIIAYTTSIFLSWKDMQENQNQVVESSSSFKYIQFIICCRTILYAKDYV